MLLDLGRYPAGGPPGRPRIHELEGRDAVGTAPTTFIGIDAYVQGIVKGIIIVVAVIADQYRQRKRKKA